MILISISHSLVCISNHVTFCLNICRCLFICPFRIQIFRHFPGILRRREKNWLGECPCNEADDAEEFDKEAAQAGKPVEQRM